MNTTNKKSIIKYLTLLVILIPIISIFLGNEIYILLSRAESIYFLLALFILINVVGYTFFVLVNKKYNFYKESSTIAVHLILFVLVVIGVVFGVPDYFGKIFYSNILLGILSLLILLQVHITLYICSRAK